MPYIPAITTILSKAIITNFVHLITFRIWQNAVTDFSYKSRDEYLQNLPDYNRFLHACGSPGAKPDQTATIDGSSGFDMERVAGCRPGRAV